MRSPLALVTAAVVLAFPAAAPAATISGAGGAIDFKGGPGEANDVVADSTSGGVRVRDAGAPLTPLGDCHAEGDAAICPLPTAGVTIDLGDGNDKLHWRLFRVDSAKGGPGDDQISVTGAADGGPGADTLDAFSVSYANRTAGVDVTLDGVANDGEPGEGDNLARVLQSVQGGSGDDFISAADGVGIRVVLGGNGGNDRLVGGPGPDGVFGEDGNDYLDGGPAADFLNGGTGADELHGGGDRDGDEVLGGRGSDRVFVGSYARLDMADFERDEITCLPPGALSIGADGIDELTGCTYAYIRFSPVARVYTSREGRVRVRVFCDSSLGRPCHGAVRLRPRDSKTTLARATFHLRHHDGDVLELKLTPAGRKLQRQRSRVSARLVATHSVTSDPPPGPDLDSRDVRWVTRR